MTVQGRLNINLYFKYLWPFKYPKETHCTIVGVADNRTTTKKILLILQMNYEDSCQMMPIQARPVLHRRHEVALHLSSTVARIRALPSFLAAGEEDNDAARH